MPLLLLIPGCKPWGRSICLTGARLCQSKIKSAAFRCDSWGDAVRGWALTPRGRGLALGSWLRRGLCLVLGW